MIQQLTAACIVGALSLVCAAAPASAPAADRPEYLVGVYYFAGWWPGLPNKWQTDGRDWRPDWPDRIPALGEYNEQAVMDREIAAAADHGIDFFQILYYCQRPGAPTQPHEEMLNVGLDQFMASPNSARMKFTIEVVNHAPFDAPEIEEWRAACMVWARAMQHPSYLRIDGRPVFKIHGYDWFLKGAGRKVEVAKERLNLLRSIVREAGSGEIMLSAGVMPMEIPEGPLASEFDFFTTYMAVPPLAARAAPYPYTKLTEDAENGWNNQIRKNPHHYVPYLAAGWDPRPWKVPSPSFTMPTRAEWTDALQRAKRALDTEPRLGVPTRTGRQKMLLIYAWNEFGEGGILAPTRNGGTMKLEAIRAVFRGSSHRPLP